MRDPARPSPMPICSFPCVTLGCISLTDIPEKATNDIMFMLKYCRMLAMEGDVGPTSPKHTSVTVMRETVLIVH